jgi:hypothetical protein
LGRLRGGCKRVGISIGGILTDLKSKTALVWDNGLFVSLAVTLSKQFGKVLYYCPWVTGFPTSQLQMIAMGVPEIESVDSPWTRLDEVDIFVFPDVYEGDVQKYLVSLGKRVWGCRGGCELEIDRAKSKEISTRLGIEVGPYKTMMGIEKLRRYLKANDDQYVKISRTRGDMETFHAPTFEAVEGKLDEIDYKLGPKADLMEFIVEDNTGPAIELAYDGYTIDGQFTDYCLVGVEAKDTALVAKVVKYSKIPAAVSSINAKLSPQLKKYNYRGFLSAEIRSTEDGHDYLIDPCCRMPSPPGELYQIMMTNLGDIVWYGAEGVLIEPEFSGKWGAELILTSEELAESWVKVTYPKEYDENVKLRYFTEHEGSKYVIPQANKMPFLGAVVAYGDTAKEAIGKVTEIAKTVHALEIKSNPDALETALADLKETLGASGDAPVSKEQAKAEDMVKSGVISKRAFERLAEKQGWA